MGVKPVFCSGIILYKIKMLDLHLASAINWIKFWNSRDLSDATRGFDSLNKLLSLRRMRGKRANLR